MSASKRQIDILTQYFYPENAAVAQYMTELAIELSRAGLGIKILAGRAPYHRAETPSSFEIHKSIPIHRFGTSRLDKRNPAGRILSITAFLVGVLFELLRSRRSDLLVVSNAPILGILGLLSKKLRRQKYVCIIEDVYPDL